MVHEFTDDNFEAKVLESKQLVLVDFWASWCPPCRKMEPIVKRLASENRSIKVGKLDVDANPISVAAYKVSAIPTLIIFKGGKVVKQFVGIQSRRKLQAALDKALDA
jgi:thioredoxin 1